MALIENFYNNDRARDIRELLTRNFANVARYIPNNFLSLTAIERENLTDDYKAHFKFVFNLDDENVYRWSTASRTWDKYLISAWDDVARQFAHDNADASFVKVELGVNEEGQSDPYTFTFYNRKHDIILKPNHLDGDNPVARCEETAKDSITLTGLNVKFNDDYSVTTIIQKLLDDLKSLDDFVGNRTDITNNADITANTVCGAIKEINQKTIDNKDRLDSIMDGTTKVPEAVHAEHADLADVATMAKDSELFGGEEPSFYAKQTDLDNTNILLNNTISRVTQNESDIAGLVQKTDKTNADLEALDKREAGHYKEYEQTREVVADNVNRIGALEEGVDDILSQLGWEILTV